jgi:hypothetical protein
MTATQRSEDALCDARYQMPLSGGFEWTTTVFFLVAWYGAAAAYAASAYLPPRGALAVLLGGLLLVGLLLSGVGVATLWALHRTALPLFYLTGLACRALTHGATLAVAIDTSAAVSHAACIACAHTPGCALQACKQPAVSCCPGQCKRLVRMACKALLCPAAQS